MAASCDLGKLGARTGPAVNATWTRPNLLPILVPWLGLLVLLTLKANRSGAAWAVWVPLAAGVAGISCVRPLFRFIPSTPLDLFCETFLALPFGLAAVWLLGHTLEGASRFVGFWKMLLPLAGGSLVAYGVRQDWSDSDASGGLVLLGILCALLPLSLSLAGYACRHGYGPFSLAARVGIRMVLAALALALPFLLFLLANTSRPSARDLGFFFGTILSLAAVAFVVLLPFLVLAFLNPFYRQRIETLLHLPSVPSSPPA